ncbi:hypothetical protein GGI15_000498 [Coemansia interrupta]|uniref:Uncharacterized protein n=1 Tax=Coemansia interrupta TaxID=1126814 RepID=A0A9W8HR15_9FUNG|nr:hypothetical protein GGI15_000498 [Coemansia interrupta]
MPHHSFIAIHDKSPESRILYMSSGVRQALGVQPQDMIGQSAYAFLASDTHTAAYPHASCGSLDETCVTILDLNAQHTGTLLATRVHIFSCDSCNLIVATMQPGHVRRQPPAMDVCRPFSPSSEPSEPSASAVRVARETRLRACLVLGPWVSHPVVSADGGSAGVVTNPLGPRVVFATNSVSRMLDVDGDELVDMPFLRMVAPESLGEAAGFLERLGRQESFVFARIFLVRRPGDAGEVGWGRAEVEVVGARSDDGAVLLCRMLGVYAAPQVGGMANGGSGWMAGRELDPGYASLAELLSSDAETSDCPMLYATTKC